MKNRRNFLFRLEKNAKNVENGEKEKITRKSNVRRQRQISGKYHVCQCRCNDARSSLFLTDTHKFAFTFDSFLFSYLPVEI